MINLNDSLQFQMQVGQPPVYPSISTTSFLVVLFGASWEFGLQLLHSGLHLGPFSFFSLTALITMPEVEAFFDKVTSTLTYVVPSSHFMPFIETGAWLHMPFTPYAEETCTR